MPVFGKPGEELELLNYSELLALPDPSWLIDGILPKRVIAELFGDVEAFKSFVALDWAHCVSLGRPWYGRECAEGKVLYIVAEGADGFKARAAAWCQVNGVKESALEFKFITIREPMLISRGEERRKIVRALKEMDVKVRLVVIDTLNWCIDGDECSPNDMTAFTRGVRLLQKALGNPTMLILHHPGKDKSKGATGAYVLKRNVNTELKLVKKRGNSLSTTLTCTKQKDGKKFNKIIIELKEVELPSGVGTLAISGTRDREDEDPRLARVRELRQKGRTQRQIAEETGMSKTTVARLLTKLGDPSDDPKAGTWGDEDDDIDNDTDWGEEDAKT